MEKAAEAVKQTFLSSPAHPLTHYNKSVSVAISQKRNNSEILYNQIKGCIDLLRPCSK